jgi:hypothetical protein
VHGRRATGDSHPRPGSRETLKRQKPQESIGLAPWLTPRGKQRTPSRCEALKTGRPWQRVREWRRLCAGRTRTFSDNQLRLTHKLHGRLTARGLRVPRGITAALEEKALKGKTP